MKEKSHTDERVISYSSTKMVTYKPQVTVSVNCPRTAVHYKLANPHQLIARRWDCSFVFRHKDKGLKSDKLADIFK